MRFRMEENALIGYERNELLEVRAWGVDSFRVRVTQYPKFSGNNQALDEVDAEKVDIKLGEFSSEITNGKIRCVIDHRGFIIFYDEDKQILKEYYRSFNGANEHSPSMKIFAREFKAIPGGDYSITMRFEENKDEKIFGMGQYQQDNLDLKGCILELAQRNSQISIPFYISSYGYGFLWNNPGIGEAIFGKNYTQWNVKSSEELDYWITVGDNPKDIISNYTSVTGRAPKFPENALGLWQCKLRYRTQEEVLEVAREYKKRNIPLDVIVIDFFHWIRQGDWSFDPEYWPDPLAMLKELNDMGTRCMISVWPTVDRKSVNFNEAVDKGLIVRTERGSIQCFDFQGDTVIYDATNPKARDFIWEKCKENYYDYGIDMFWLDEAEPEYAAYDFDNYRYYEGSALKVANIYPKLHAKAFYDGLKSEGRDDIVNLLRCAWVGSQKYAALVWSGDILSNFQSLRDQFAAGLNIGLSGIPWWVSDTGGFFGDKNDEHFNELLIRWFQFGTFCPVLRMHGDRGPHDIKPLSELDYGGGFSFTGQPNELWSYGEETYEILKKHLDIRLSLKYYIKDTLDEASKNGSPVIRTMFYEFPNDNKCWEIKEQYMFGEKYLVAPVLYQGVTKRSVYLPLGEWKNINDDQVYTGPVEIDVDAPIEVIPVFERIK